MTINTTIDPTYYNADQLPEQFREPLTVLIKAYSRSLADGAREIARENYTAGDAALLKASEVAAELWQRYGILI